MNALVGAKLMLAFAGTTAPPRILEWIKTRAVAGFTIFRELNVVNPAQIRELTDQLQSSAQRADRPPLLLATDQEGGQLLGLGEETTQFAGNMALAATRDRQLAQEVAYAMGLEMAAMGLNVNYAPNGDVNSNPVNPAAGIRTFGDNPVLAAEMAAAMVAGFQAAGVAATIKHFPGAGDAAVDSHYQMPRIDHSRERLEATELVPFKAAIAAGVRLVMSGHFSIPSLTNGELVPATLSKAVMDDFLRQELGFSGITITDALDMGAITQGAGQIIDVVAAVRAGIDLLLLTADADTQERIYQGLQLAYARGLFGTAHLTTSQERLLELQQWLGAQAQPDLSIVACAAHQQLANTVAERSITLVRDEAGLLPLQLESTARVAVIMPQPHNLTPADTSAFVPPTLATAVRLYHDHITDFITSQTPTNQEISSLREAVAGFDLLIIGTISAHTQTPQAELMKALLALEIPAITVALRTPYDLGVYPDAAVHLCTYGLLPPSLSALAAVLWGKVQPAGRLPVTLPDLYPFGHGLSITKEYAVTQI